MSEKPWPPYRIGNADHIHALGAIASLFNLLEFNFRSIFKLYLGMHPIIAYRLFANINNARRLELTDQAVDYSHHPDPIKEDVRYFLTGYKICNDNRNILMHSLAMFTWLDPNAERCPLVAAHIQPDAVAFQKAGRDNPLKINIYEPTLTELRGVADAIKAFEDYGNRLYWHILATYDPIYLQRYGLPEGAQFALPDRPAQPTLIPFTQAPMEPL